MPDDKRSSPIGRGFAKRLMQVRQARGVSQEGLADQVGTNQGVVSRIESGKRAMHTSIELAVRFARVLHVDTGWLLTGIVPDGKWKPPKLDPKAENVPGRPKRST